MTTPTPDCEPMDEINGTVEVPTEAWALLHEIAAAAVRSGDLEDRFYCKRKLDRVHELEREHSWCRRMAARQQAEKFREAAE